MLAVCLLDPNTAEESALGCLMTPETMRSAKEASRLRGIVDGHDLARMFAWMRPNDLIWNYWVNNYLLGNQPPAFDILYWNADTTRLPARLHGDYLDLYFTNPFVNSSQLTLSEIPIDMSKVAADSYVIAGITDHITPWKGVYKTAQIWAKEPPSCSRIAATFKVCSIRQQTQRRHLRSDRSIRLGRMHFSPRPRNGREAGGSIGAIGCTRAPVKRLPRQHRLTANAIPFLRKPRGLTSLNDRPSSGDRANGGLAGPRGPAAAAFKPGEIEVRQISISGQLLQVAIRHGSGDQPPLLLFNGIGANWELAKPFLEALTHTTAIIFDVPGVGGSPMPSLPYRPSTLARLAAGLVAELGYSEIDVAGVSWGGGVAQQFAHQYPKLCRRLVLAATSPGAIMVPAGPSVLWKMATPRRYTDKDYMSKVAPEIYGGDFRKNPSLIDAHASAMRGTRNRGYLYQLLAMTGWTSLPWLWSLPQPTLILMGSDDPLVPPMNGRVLALLIPNAELRMIDDGHLFMVTRPAETAGIIEEFLAEGKNEPAQRSSLFSRAVGWRRRFPSTSGGPHP